MKGSSVLEEKVNGWADLEQEIGSAGARGYGITEGGVKGFIMGSRPEQGVNEATRGWWRG